MNPVVFSLKPRGVDPLLIHSASYTGYYLRRPHRDTVTFCKSYDTGLLMANSKYEYVKNFEVDNKLLPNTWIVVRIDGRHFHQFSDKHEFEKPNDVQAINLMNSCAVALLEEFPDIIFAYGVSDEYSKIISIIGSFFTANYVMKWKEFFPHKDLRSTPSFDARTVCYPSNKELHDYLSWRQVDCHINNQYNTCFWMLVKSGKTKQEAQDILKGTLTQDKNEILFQQFDINYNTLPAIFRKGSCVFKDRVFEIVKYTKNGDPVKRVRKKVIIQHCDIIEKQFWEEHPWILDD